MAKNLFVSQVCSMPHYMPGQNVAAKLMVSEEFSDRLFVMLTVEGNKGAPLEIPLSDILCLSPMGEDGIYLYAGAMGEFVFAFRKAEWAQEAETQLRGILLNHGISPAATLDEYIASLDEDGRTAFRAQCQQNDQNRQMAQEQAAAKRRKSSLHSSIIGYVVTAGLALYGLTAYAQGNYITWFGIPFDTAWKFMLLIAGFLVFDTWALIRALKNK